MRISESVTCLFHIVSTADETESPVKGEILGTGTQRELRIWERLQTSFNQLFSGSLPLILRKDCQIVGYMDCSASKSFTSCSPNISFVSLKSIIRAIVVSVFMKARQSSVLYPNGNSSMTRYCRFAPAPTHSYRMIDETGSEMEMG
jgi:hypothetical protein